MVPVGVIGLGPAWDSRYLPTLRSLQNRIRVKAIFDFVPARAAMAAAELQASVVGGIRAIAFRDDVKALLVFDTGWGGLATIRLLGPIEKPIFLGGNFAIGEAGLADVCRISQARSSTVMPELSDRYTPATFRFRELMATRLGRAQSIEIEALAPAVPIGSQPLGNQPWIEFVARLADWCSHIVPTAVLEVESNHEPFGGPETIHIRFANPRSGGIAPAISIRLKTTDALPSAQAASPIFRARCERGTAEIVTATRIKWSVGEADCEETLSSERTDVQVMLDHFCRRVVGGLIPVADLNDLCRSQRLAYAAAESLRIGSPVVP